MTTDPTVATKMTTHGRDLVQVGGDLAGWLAGPLQADGPVEVGNVHAPTGGGMSSVTILLDATFHRGGELTTKSLVVRLPPDDSGFAVFPSYDLRRQYDAMSAAAARVPVPPLVGVEDSSELLGAPFLVMEAVAGWVPSDNPPYVFGGTLYDATPEERRALQNATVDVLAGIHASPVDAVPVLLAEAGSDSLRAHVDAQREYYAWTHSRDGVRIPILERTFDWLEARWPADPGEPVLVWGDSRPGNIIFDGFAPAAVLDWEMAAVAPRGVDLAWMVLIHQFFQDIAEVFELPGLPDFCRAEDVHARYAEVTGVQVSDFEWYVVYAALRHGIVMSQVKRRMVHNGEETMPEHPDDYVMHRALIERLIG
jgi:aminoglycoside phosphotransferase (APT) family kinase protein